MTVKVLSSLAIKAAYLELVPGFERQSKQKLDTTWAGTADIRKRMLAGETSDVVIGPAALIDDLTRIGSLDSRSRVDLAKSSIGAAVRAGAPKPDIGSVEALKSALRAAKSIIYSSGPSGVYIAELLQRLGIAQELKAKAKQAPPGTLVGELVARGQFELCFQQLSELRQVSGIDYVGPLPAEVQLVTLFAGGVHSKSAQANAAKAWLRFLASRDAAPVMLKHGLEPAQ
jgi:molybdate transport system substrate-binding protein